MFLVCIIGLAFRQFIFLSDPFKNQSSQQKRTELKKNVQNYERAKEIGAGYEGLVGWNCRVLLFLGQLFWSLLFYHLIVLVSPWTSEPFLSDPTSPTAQSKF